MVSLRRVAAFVLALLLTAGVVSAQTPPDFAGSWTGAIAGGLHLGTFEVTQDNGAVTGVFRTSHSSQPRKVTGTVRPDGVLEAFFDGERSRPFEVRRVEGPALEVTMDGGRMIFRPTVVPPPGQAPAELSGAFDGPATTHHHGPTGLTFDLPQGWKVTSERGDSLVLAAEAEASLPGPRQLMLLIHDAPSSAEKSGDPLVRIVGELGAELLRPFGDRTTSGHMTVEPRAVTVGDAPGAEASWSITLTDDVVVAAWIGAARVSDGRVVLFGAVVERGREREDLPRAKRVLASARLTE